MQEARLAWRYNFFCDRNMSTSWKQVTLELIDARCATNERQSPLISHCCLLLISRQYPLANTCKRTIQGTYHGLETPGCCQVQFKKWKQFRKREIFVERNRTDFKRDDRFQESYVSVGFPIYLLSNKRLGRFRRFWAQLESFCFRKIRKKHVVCAIYASYPMIFIPTPTWRYHSGQNQSNSFQF